MGADKGGNIRCISVYFVGKPIETEIIKKFHRYETQSRREFAIMAVHHWQHVCLLMKASTASLAVASKHVPTSASPVTSIWYRLHDGCKEGRIKNWVRAQSTLCIFVSDTFMLEYVCMMR